MLYASQYTAAVCLLHVYSYYQRKNTKKKALDVLALHPRDYDVVLSLVFADGCVFASVQPREKVHVGQVHVRHAHDAVCKAQVPFKIKRLNSALTEPY